MDEARKKLIELIHEGQGCPADHDPFGACDECQYFELHDCFSERLADYMIARGVTVQRWIPVAERLPEENKYVAVYRPNMVLHLLVTRRILGDWENFHIGVDGKNLITHWTPLPEGPKEEQQHEV